MAKKKKRNKTHKALSSIPDLPELPEFKEMREKTIKSRVESEREAQEKQKKEKKEKTKVRDTKTKVKNKKKKKAKTKEKKQKTKKTKEEKEDKHKEGVIEKYEIEVDKAKVKTEVRREEGHLKFNLIVPEIGKATAALLDEIRSQLITVTTVSMKEILDPSAFKSIKKRFIDRASEILKNKLPNIKEDMHDFLVGKLIQDMLGLGEIEFLVNDPNLEEIVIPSAKESVRVYHKKYGWLSTNLTISKEEDIVNYSNIVARRVGRQITVLTPLLDAHLVSGDRVNAVLYPISTKGNTITIRKFARDPLTIVDLINSNTCSIEIASLLWLAIEYEMNVLVSGGTASGKTTFLNACLPFIPPNHRIISVEDTRELMLPDFLYWTPLVTRAPNPEGKGEVSMIDLLVNSLRMRPDRIILGEIRRQKEAEVLFEAMHTGHSVYATVHADSAAETISRLTNPPINVPPNLLKAVNLNIVMFRDRRRGVRKALQVAEFESGRSGADANIIYRWVPEGDKFVKHSESSRIFEDLSRMTGLSERELNQNLKKKMEIISWLVKNNIRDLNDFGTVMNVYYTDEQELISAMKKKDIKRILKR
jgi:flagellar protein FlaI